MAKLSLQIKNVATLVLSLGTSVFTGVAAKRFFDTPAKPWGWLAAIGLLFLVSQAILLLAIESKEEEELSLLRTDRLNRIRHTTAERERFTLRIQQEIERGTPESLREWQQLRETHLGE
jgi:hypothetical protein